MKTKSKLSKNLQDIHIFQFRVGYSGQNSCIGTIRRRVHETSTVFPEQVDCADQPLQLREFFWITLFSSNKQKWPVTFEENWSNLDWIIEGWQVSLPANVDTSKLKFV